NGSVLVVTSNFPRWKGDSVTPFVLHLVQGLQAVGWRVGVLAPHAEGAAIHEIIDGVRVDRFRYMWPASQETVCYGGGALVNLRQKSSRPCEAAGPDRRRVVGDHPPCKALRPHQLALDLAARAGRGIRTA